jgi:hypothetical protein
MAEFTILLGIFLVGLIIVGIYSKWISYNVAKGFYEGKKAFFNNLQEKRNREEKNEEK